MNQNNVSKLCKETDEIFVKSVSEKHEAYKKAVVICASQEHISSSYPSQSIPSRKKHICYII